MKTKLFSLPLYSPQLYVVVGKTTGEELYQNVLKRFKVSIPRLKHEVDGCDGNCNLKDDLVVLWVYTLHGPGAINTLAHESFHATTAVLRNAGMRLTPSSEEAYAYLTGWITQTVWDWSRK